MLAEKLNMTPDKAEEWIVNLIRNARLDAKIDSQAVLCSNPMIDVADIASGPRQDGYPGPEHLPPGH